MRIIADIRKPENTDFYQYPQMFGDINGKLWKIAGPLELNAWKYSNERGKLSREQLLSTIMLLEKREKALNNLRPIRHVQECHDHCPAPFSYFVW